VVRPFLLVSVAMLGQLALDSALLPSLMGAIPQPGLLAMLALAFSCTAPALLLPLCAAEAVPARAVGLAVGVMGVAQAAGIALVGSVLVPAVELAGGGLGGVFALPVVAGLAAWQVLRGLGQEAGAA
jgi:hypothetical protein